MSLQIPNLHISSKTKITGSASFGISSRSDAVQSGTFTIKCNVSFDPAADTYPAGALDMKIELTDGMAGTVKATSIEQLNSWGKHTPTASLTGRCEVESKDHKFVGCRFWLLYADNKRDKNRTTPDIASFLIFDNSGARVAYGTGPVTHGDIKVSPSGD